MSEGSPLACKTFFLFSYHTRGLGWGIISGVSSFKVPNHTMRASPLRLHLTIIIFQRPYLQTLSLWHFVLQLTKFGRTATENGSVLLKGPLDMGCTSMLKWLPSKKEYKVQSSADEGRKAKRRGEREREKQGEKRIEGKCLTWQYTDIILRTYLTKLIYVHRIYNERKT